MKKVWEEVDELKEKEINTINEQVNKGVQTMKRIQMV